MRILLPASGSLGFLLMCGLIVAQAAEPKCEPQIEDTIRQFFKSVAQKDLAGIQRTVEPQFLIVEAEGHPTPSGVQRE